MLDQTRDIAINKGWTLISTNYNYKDDRLKFKCDKNHDILMSPSELKRGFVCYICYNNRSERSKLQFLETLKRDGYSLVDPYLDSNIAVTIKCPNGHEYKVKNHQFMKGYRCNKCRCSKIKINIKKNEVFNGKERFLTVLSLEKYKLISEYEAFKKKVTLKCPNNHIWKVTPSNFLRVNGCRCSKCIKRCSESAKREFEDLVKDEGYILPEDYVYINGDTYLCLKCPHGHDCWVSPYKFKRNQRCYICKDQLPRKVDKFMSTIKEENYTLESNYVKSEKNVILRCPYEHPLQVLPSKIINKSESLTCKFCSLFQIIN